MTEAIFDRAAPDYDSWYKMELGKAVDQAERGKVERMFKTSGPQVLEVGSGTGQYTTWLLQQGYQVTAVDISGEMMAVAKEKVPASGYKVRWWQADICDILDELGKYHGILSITAFEFISRPDLVLAKLFSKLEPGGCLLIGLIAGNSPWSEYYSQVARLKPTSVFASAKFYTEEEIRQWPVGGRLEVGKCLYFAPGVASVEEALALEKQQTGQAGFIVAKWIKD